MITKDFHRISGKSFAIMKILAKAKRRAGGSRSPLVPLTPLAPHITMATAPNA